MGNHETRTTTAVGVDRPLSTGGKRVKLEIIPLSSVQPLADRVLGISAAEAKQGVSIPKDNNRSNILRLEPQGRHTIQNLSQDQLIQMEQYLRKTALSTNDRIFLGLNSTPVVETDRNRFAPLYQPSDSLRAALGSGIGKGGVYQLMRFPIGRLNGVSLPAGSNIRFADPTRWFKGVMETRLFTVSVKGTNKFYAWDAHLPVGNHPHNFYHVNQKGMHSVFGHSNHANLGGAQLAQAKQLRYLKVGGRVFLVVGVLVDTVQLAAATAKSIEEGTPRPFAAQAVRTAGSWGMAWAGAKAGVLIGGAAGVETGPGLVLTAIGGGIIGGVAGYFGADWVADWIYED